jgi:N12 class adenine-specific DNA methylase
MPFVPDPAPSGRFVPDAPATDDRSGLDWLKDLGASALGGLVTAAKLPAAVADRAITGQWYGPGVQALDEFGESIDDQKSQDLQQREKTRQNIIRNVGTLAQRAVGGGDGAIATAARETGEALASAYTLMSDPKLLANAFASQLGLLGMTRMGGRVADAAANSVERVAPNIAATRVGKAAVEGAGTAGAVGTGAVLQGVDIGSETQKQLMALPDKLWEQIPEFKALADQVGPDEAKARLINDKAFMATAQAGLASVLSSMLPHGAAMERALVGKLPPGAKLKEIAHAFTGEARQEGIEEGFGRLAINEAVQSVDPTRDRWQGVGSAAGEGAALGGALGSSMTAGRMVMDYRRGGKPEPANPSDSADGASTPPADVQPMAPEAADRVATAPGASGSIDAAEILGAVPEAETAPQAAVAGVPNGQEEDQAQEVLMPEPDQRSGDPARPAIREVRGNDTTFTTEDGRRLGGRYSLVEADDLQTSHDVNLRPNPNYPPELQPRNRERAASALQIQNIVGRMDPARLGLSADAATGAPIVGDDGLVESGNARTIALKRIYQARGQKAENYKDWLRQNANQFGLSPEQVDGMQQPVLVRVRSTPVDRAEFARQANASTVAQMSPAEQAKADAARVDAMDDLRPTDDGDFSRSREFIRRFIARLPQTEQAGMIDADGRLSTAGYSRVRNAVLAKAYGDSAILTRLVESMDDNQRNISKALLIAAPRVAKARAAIGDGRLFDADLTPHLVDAADTLSRLKEQGTSVDDALAQAGLLGDEFSPETRELIRFLADNVRRPRKVAEFITAYFDALDAAGDPAQGSLLGDVKPPTAIDLMGAARRTTQGAKNVPTQGTTNGATKESSRGDDRAAARAGAAPGLEPETAPGAGRSNEGGEAAPAVAANEAKGQGWVKFPPASGTLGIPRAKMPQVKLKLRPKLYAFLESMGIGSTTETVAAADLKPTQAEFSPEKVEGARSLQGDAAGVLVSSDGYVLDGHHRWLARAMNREPVEIRRFDAPIDQLLDAVREFSGTTVSNESEALREKRAEHVERFYEAAGDLAAILTKNQRAAMVPENTPGLMPTLVKMFSEAIAIVGTDIRRATAWVKQRLKADPEYRKLWNKVSDETYRKAALQAIERGASGHGYGGDLFSQPEKPAQGGLFDGQPDRDDRPRAAMINGEAYDAKRHNFKPPRTDEFLSEELLDRVRGYIAKFAKEAPPLQISPEERAQAEALVKPMLERSAAEKVAYDQKIIDIAQRTGALGQMLAPLKSVKRASEKLVMEPRAADGSMDTTALKDLLRSTIVVSSYADAQAVVDEIYREFNVMPGRVKDRTDAKIQAPDVTGRRGFLPSGYGDVLINVVMPNGSVAEIQINVPEMLAAKQNEGHKLYEVERGQPKGSQVQQAVEAAQSDLYRAAAAAAASRKAASLEGAPRGGSDRASRSSPDESSSLKTRPSGKATQSSPEKSDTNRQPSGNLSGSFNSVSPTSIVPDHGSSGYAQGSLFGANDDATAADDRGGDARQGAEDVRGPEGIRSADVDNPRSGVADQRAGDDSGDGAAPARGVGSPAAAGERSADESGREYRARNRSRRGAAVPAGRDIKPKSGRNYRLTDDDLTYEGSWQKKAERNVEAVELLKKLQAEGRQATVDEQRVLAKFIGWGASEIANNLFGDKLDKVRKLADAYERVKAAMASLKRDYLRKGGTYRGDYADADYYTALDAMRLAGKPMGYPDRITLADLETIKPEPVTLRWLELRDRLKKAMTPEEWAEASRSTQYAHYTSKGVVRAMWAAAERFGFKGGMVLEPGAGIGIFPGLMPDALAANVSYTGIEYDSITGGILAQLQPDELIRVEGYQETKLPRDFYDLAIGNPPFSGTKILSDPEYAKHAFALHDYFFAKTIDRVRPGGLVMFVTSRYTMDKLTDKARTYMAARAGLVGAIRLPQTAFKQNAGTDVVTDVLFLRKKVPGETFAGAQPWSKSLPMKVGSREFQVNEYFHAHPDMVLGTPSDTGKMQNNPEPQYTVLAPEGDIEALFAAAVERMPADVYRPARGSAAEAAVVREIDFNPKAQKEGNYYVTDAGVLMQREEGVGKAVIGKATKYIKLLKDFVPLRDALKQAHYDQLNGGDWESSLKALQAAYKAFTDKNGAVNQSVARNVRVKIDEIDENGNPTGRKVDDVEERRVYPLLQKLNDDPDWTLVAALEKVDEETGATSPSPFLTSRVLGAPERARIATPADALLSVLNDTGEVNIDMIAERIDMEPEAVIEALGSAIYENPEGGKWETADQYLSGNVKRKLQAAEEAAKADRRYERNVDALRAVQPAPKTPAQIDISLGMNWIPGSVYEQFLQRTAGIRAHISFNEATRQWVVQMGSVDERNRAATADWGTSSRHAGELLEHALTGRPVSVMKTVRTGRDIKQVFDADATEAANAKLEALKEEFSKWVWSDAERTNRLVRIYNDKFNTTVPRSFDGRHLTLPGTSKAFAIHDHVKRGAWRIVQSGNTYLAHAVGSGKTFQMVISAMEQKRLGMIKKPMVVVPNHMLQQFAREWQELYPTARLMVADENGFHTDNRRRWAARVALSNLDGVIITQSAFKLLDIDPSFKAKIIDEQLDYLRASLDEAKGEEDGGSKKKSPRIKQIEKQIENLEEKLKNALSGVGKDRNVRFDELGVDFLYVDEAHAYRKLDFATARKVKGIQPDGSAQALDLYIKARYLEEKRPGRSLVMASGTPVTNTLAELYTVQRFMDRQALIDRGIEDFDSWAAMFGRERTTLESNAAGRYEPVTRFNKFVNVAELTQMFRQFADVLTSDKLSALLGSSRPKVDGGSRRIIVTPKTKAYAEYQKVLAARYEASRAWKPSKDEPNNPDPVIAIIGDGRLAAIDMRFINPKAPNDPDSKLNRMIDDVIAAFKTTADMEYYVNDDTPEPIKGATMMVFSDLGFGEGVSANRGFSARAWMEKRLRDAGVPASQVAFMSDYKKSTDKLKLFRDLNAGRVRILVGSSKNMGTGVNAQQRLLNLFHLDSPWFPADLEQREGRIIRQGNKNKVVRIHAYAAKGSYDETMWGMLARKQFFIDQALSGDENLREIEDLDSVSQYDMAAALVAEDPRVLQLAGLKAEAEKLQRLYRAHEDQRQGFRSEFSRALMTADFLRQKLPEAEALAGKARDLSGNRFVAKAGNKTFTNRTEWADALKAEAGKLAANVAPSATIGDVSGFPVRYVSTKTESSYTWHVELATPEPVMLISVGDENPLGMAMRAVNAVADVARTPERLREKIAQAESTADALRPRLETPFPMSEILAGKLREAADLEAQIAADSKERTWRVERIDTGLGFDVQASSAERAIEKAVASNGGTPGDWRAIEGASKPEDKDGARLSRGAGGGMDLAALRAVRDRVVEKLPGLPPVVVLPDPSHAPAALQSIIMRRGAWGDVEGALHDGKIYLFASGLADEARAEFVLAEHEAAHAGLRGLLGAGLNAAMQALHNQSTDVRRAAAPLIKQGMTLAEAVEEVIVDIPAARLARLKGWRALVGKVRDALRARGFERTANLIDHWLAGYLTEQQRADLLVADLVRAARAYVARKPGRAPAGTALSTGRLADDLAAQEKWLTEQALAAGYASIEDMLEKDYPRFERLAAEWRQENPAEVMLSRAAAGGNTAPATAPTPADRAEAIIRNAARAPKPIDAVVRGFSRVTGIERAAASLYGLGARLIDRITPERVKAGLVSDYGVPEAVIDQRAQMTGSQREQLRQAGKLLEKLATMTRAESRVAYEWMTGEDTRTADELMQALPEESVAVLRQVRDMIDGLSKEAVRLGQLEPEAFERHRFAYLRRSYFKHEHLDAQDMTASDRARKERVLTILGDQYKGRGMVAKAPMRQIQNVAPEWWKRKLVAGKADTSLKGEKFERLERRAPRGDGTMSLDGMGENTRPGKLLEVHYWPVGEVKPAKYADWESAGAWEVRDTKGDDVILWRDFTKAERMKMGEIDEARYAIAKTLHRMIHDIEVGRYLEWLAHRYAKKPGEVITGKIVEASERYRDSFKPDEWVLVPDAKIPGTSVQKYGALAGRYLPGPIWNDLRQVVNGQFKPLGETYHQILRMWKTAKTALSPGVHTNNIMANFVMADWHDVSAGHVAKSLRIILGASQRDGTGVLGRAGNALAIAGLPDAEAAREILSRYQISGGAIGGWVTQEIANEQMEPIVAALRAELAGTAAQAAPQEIGVYAALQHLMHRRFPQAWEAFKASRPATAVATDGKNLIDLYQAEDDVFRLAAWLKAKEQGMSDAEAGKVARRSFLDYSINAPWVAAMRASAWPFVAFTYRAVPMLLETAGKRPHKILKLMAIAGVLNWLGGALGGGDDERKLLPEEKAGRIWGLVPKLIRMPWNDANGSPVYLDIRRWIPVGDVVDLDAGHAALPLPPALYPGGPLVILGEIAFNKSAFTGKPIVLETDTGAEQTGKIIDHLWKAFMPNLLGVPNTYATEGVAGAMSGRTDAFGREMSVPMAIASSVGVKVGAYPADVLRRNLMAKTRAEEMEIDKQIAQLKRQLQTKQITADEFADKAAYQQEKKAKLWGKVAEKMGP